MINDKNSSGLTYGLCERTWGVTVSTDFTLPDYQSEIRRVLGVFPNVLFPAKYVTSDAVEISGTVDYRLLYIGADGGIWCAPLSAPYNFSLPIEDRESGEELEIFCNICADNVSTRVSAPRRLTVKTNLVPNVRVLARRSADVSVGEGAPIESIYKKSEKGDVLKGESGLSDMINLEYTFSDMADDTRVVLADGVVRVSDTFARAARMECRGEVSLCLLCVSEECGEYRTLTASVPFEGEIDMECCNDDSRVNACGALAEMTVDITDAGIECKMGVILSGTCMQNVECEYTSDVYSSENECECVTSTLGTRHSLACGNANFSVSERVNANDSGIAEASQLLCTLGRVNMDKCELAEDKLVFDGNAVFSVVYQKDGEISCTDVSVPVKYQATPDKKGSVASFAAFCEVGDIRARLSDGKLCLDCEVMMAYDCMGEESISMAQSVTFGERVEKGESELAVCYTGTGDTLWSVAKRYKVAPSDVTGSPETDKFVMIEY